MTRTKTKDMLTTGDVSRLCRVAPRTVTKWFDSGRLRGYVIPGSRDRRIPLTQLIRFLRQNGMPTHHLHGGLVRILIMDPNQERNQKLCDSLGQEGLYLIKTAETLFEGGILASGFNPGLIFVNLALEDADPKSICQEIRQMENLEHCRIVAICRPLQTGEIAALKHHGFDGCLNDPFTPRDLVETIEENLTIL